MSTSMRDPESLSMNALSVVLIAPHDGRRRALAAALKGPQSAVRREFADYPSLETLTQLIDEGCDVLIVDLDPDPERALDLVETVCSTNGAVTVMIYSSRKDPDLLVRCMRAGARELLADPIQSENIAEALVRAAARRLEVRRQRRVAGKLLVFLGVKGGSGVTTLASNFAVALAKESRSKVALVDLDVHLGDAALALGLQTKFSIADALRNVHRLDSDFLATLMTPHASGVDVLAAPDQYGAFDSVREAASAILRIVRDDYAYVVIDAGSGPDRLHDLLFQLADTMYLVAQVEISALRNANRIISHFTDAGGNQNINVVLNRFDPRKSEIDESRVAKALTMPVSWRAPNDYGAVRRAQNNGTPLVMEDSALSKMLHDMARAACGISVTPRNKKRFGLF